MLKRPVRPELTPPPVASPLTSPPDQKGAAVHMNRKQITGYSNFLLTLVLLINEKLKTAPPLSALRDKTNAFRRGVRLRRRRLQDGGFIETLKY